jgi:small GTP-binding protein
LIFRLTNKQFPQNIKPTNGYEVSLIEYRIRNRLYALSFWDSSGDEKYDQIVNAFYKDLSALILVFDLNNQKSFEDLEFWLNQAKEFITTACIPFLLGVKSDLEKTVDDGLIKELISSEKLEYFECSSLSGKGCDDLLGFLIGSDFLLFF